MMCPVMSVPDSGPNEDEDIGLIFPDVASSSVKVAPDSILNNLN